MALKDKLITLEDLKAVHDVDAGEITGIKADLADKSDTADMLKAFPTDTASGAVASFTDGANVPVKSMIVNIDPVQSGSGDPSPDNIRPITGWTGAKVTRTGKNLLPYPYSSNSGTYNGVIFTKYEDGTVSCFGTATENAFFNLRNTAESFLLKTGTYVISGAISGSIIVIGSIATNLPVGSTNINNGKFTLEKDTEVSAYIRVNPGGSVNGIIKPMISLATESDAKYEPYSGQTYDITFPSEAGAVYGGTLNAPKGELVVDRTVLTYNTANMNNSEDYPGWKDAKVADIAGAGTNTTMPEVVTNVGIGVGVNTMAIPGVIFLPKQLHNNLTQSDWKALAIDVQIVLPLVTPITYQLTPQEITSLLGINNIWSDTGDTSLAYRADTKLYVDGVYVDYRTMLAPVESTYIATRNYTSGQLLIVGNTLYKVTANIANGGTITAGTNVIATTLSEVISALA